MKKVLIIGQQSSALAQYIANKLSSDAQVAHIVTLDKTQHETRKSYEELLEATKTINSMHDYICSKFHR